MTTLILPVVGSQWRHERRGSIAVVLRVEDDVVTFQFPAVQRNLAHCTGHWASALFFAAFAPVVPS